MDARRLDPEIAFVFECAGQLAISTPGAFFRVDGQHHAHLPTSLSVSKLVLSRSREPERRFICFVLGFLLQLCTLVQSFYAIPEQSRRNVRQGHLRIL
jgi:hypothetical protein